MTDHLLDQPILAALTSSHGHFARHKGGAWRYDPLISPFAAVESDEPQVLHNLADLIAPGETVVLVRSTPNVVPEGFGTLSSACVVQMLATQHLDSPDEPRPVRLTEANEAEGYALATLTRPGPFAPQTMRMGHFWGLFKAGKLIAMAGERFRQPGWAEMSAVCVHPDHRGRGLARLLSTRVTADMQARGEAPYLHCFENNAGAIALYETLGYQIRTRLHVSVVQKAP